jgi:hypothetical protein
VSALGLEAQRFDAGRRLVLEVARCTQQKRATVSSRPPVLDYRGARPQRPMMIVTNSA